MLTNHVEQVAQINHTITIEMQGLTVARPIGVRPITSVKSSLQAKCESQRSRRGWYNGTCWPLTGSGTATLSYLWLLQPWQTSARLSRLVAPPCTRGRMCSTENAWVA